eukprot:Trichotokara_eunicae@DN4167_c0_g1_i3.p1
MILLDECLMPLKRGGRANGPDVEAKSELLSRVARLFNLLGFNGGVTGEYIENYLNRVETDIKKIKILPRDSINENIKNETPSTSWELLIDVVCLDFLWGASRVEDRWIRASSCGIDTPEGDFWERFVVLNRLHTAAMEEADVYLTDADLIKLYADATTIWETSLGKKKDKEDKKE